MARAPNASGTIDLRSSSLLMNYVHAHEPCAPGAAASHARRRMYQNSSLLSKPRKPRNREVEGVDYEQDAAGMSYSKPTRKKRHSKKKPRSLRYRDESCDDEFEDGGRGQGLCSPYQQYQQNGNIPCGCATTGKPYNGSGSVFGGNYHVQGCGQYGKQKQTYKAGGCNRNRFNDSERDDDSGGDRGGNGGGGGGGGRRGAGSILQDQNPLVSDEILEDEEDYSKFDRTSDWLTLGGAVVVVACIIGIIHSFAVFAPAIQHHYETGVLETVLIGCLTYFTLVAFIPVANKINGFLEPRWTTIFGMLLFFVGLLLDSLTLTYVMVYITHILFMGIGGSLAYSPAMSICSYHFRKHLVKALSAITCAGSLGTIFFYFLSNLMLSYVSYMWTKICLCLLVLVCMGATQTFPVRSRHSPWYTDSRQSKSKVKKCIKQYAEERDERLARKLDQDEAPKKSFLCVCICDISVWTDYSFLLWAVISMVSFMTLYIPYLFLVAYAYTVGADFAVGLVIWFCLASIVARVALMHSNDHTFGFNRTLFQICCLGSGVLYIFVSSAETYGWILVWGLAVGILEGVLCTVIPRVTLQTVPLSWIGSSWTWIIVFHAFGILIGPMIMMCVYYTTLEYGPAFILIGVAQILAGFLAFLLPNEEEATLNDLERMADTEDEQDGGQDDDGEPQEKYSGSGRRRNRNDDDDDYYPTSASRSRKNRSRSPKTAKAEKVRGGDAGEASYGSRSRYSTRSYSAGRTGTGAGTGSCGGGWTGETSSTKYKWNPDFNFAGITTTSTCIGKTTELGSYTTRCPICSAVGCIPGCCECTPGGLSSIFKGLSSGCSPGGFSLTRSYEYDSGPSYRPGGPLPAGCKDFIGEINSYLANFDLTHGSDRRTSLGNSDAKYGDDDSSRYTKNPAYMPETHLTPSVGNKAHQSHPNHNKDKNNSGKKSHPADKHKSPSPSTKKKDPKNSKDKNKPKSVSPSSKEKNKNKSDKNKSNSRSPSKEKDQKDNKKPKIKSKSLSNEKDKKNDKKKDKEKSKSKSPKNDKNNNKSKSKSKSPTKDKDKDKNKKKKAPKKDEDKSKTTKRKDRTNKNYLSPTVSTSIKQHKKIPYVSRSSSRLNISHSDKSLGGK